MKKYKLGDIAILNASIIDKKKNIEIEYLDTSSILEGHILGTQKICLSEAPSRAQRKVKNKTIIYSLVRPNQNHYGILYNTPDNFIVSTGFATIDLKEEFKETIDADFLFLLLTQKQITHHLHRIAENSASAYPSLIPSDITKLELNFPSIKKQKNIARLIQNINQKIELNRSINHNLEVMAKQLYDYWFLQFDFPDENGKPYKSSGGKMVWNKKLKREIPEGWEVDIIQNIATTYSGGTPKSANKEYYKNGTIAWINSGELNSSIITQALNYITERGLNNSSAKLYPANTVLVAMYGATTGKVSLLTFEACSNQAVCGVIPNMKEMQHYVYLYLSSLYSHFINLSIGSARDNISQEIIKNMLLPIPSTDVILMFENKVKHVYKVIIEKKKQINTLTKLRDELLPLLMNGQASLQNCD